MGNLESVGIPITRSDIVDHTTTTAYHECKQNEFPNGIPDEWDHCPYCSKMIDVRTLTYYKSWTGMTYPNEHILHGEPQSDYVFNIKDPDSKYTYKCREDIYDDRKLFLIIDEYNSSYNVSFEKVIKMLSDEKITAFKSFVKKYVESYSNSDEEIVFASVCHDEYGDKKGDRFVLDHI